MPADIFPKHMNFTICPGCLTYISAEEARENLKEDGYSDIPQCAIKPYHKGKRCPCSICLVKMVCTEVCDELNTYKMEGYKDYFTRPLPK